MIDWFFKPPTNVLKDFFLVLFTVGHARSQSLPGPWRHQTPQTLLPKKPTTNDEYLKKTSFYYNINTQYYYKIKLMKSLHLLFLVKQMTVMQSDCAFFTDWKYQSCEIDVTCNSDFTFSVKWQSRTITFAFLHNTKTYYINIKVAWLRLKNIPNTGGNYLNSKKSRCCILKWCNWPKSITLTSYRPKKKLSRLAGTQNSSIVTR